ncbi:hypothetical protein PVNG_03339 [Plasmodium vivax North Korean]|uniref:Uncharacterized protein n=1 Tax=Plasmodium vivax North Korean TaxID=1035514 RepID=A0A0J9TR44_PLAVI|nr:hypothetical protein PVNG_03339 [Plasmodium vivax North Korean]
MATASEKKWESVLKELPSSKIYAKFDDDGVSNYTCSHCNVGDAFKNKYVGLEDFCKKFEKSLKHISKPRVTIETRIIDRTHRTDTALGDGGALGNGRAGSTDDPRVTIEAGDTSKAGGIAKAPGTDKTLGADKAPGIVEPGETNGLEEKNKTEEIGNFKDNCLFLKYWLFDELNKMNKSKWTNLNIIPVIDKLNYIQYYLNTSPKINICHNNYYEYTDYSEEEKVLYDYFKDFDSIEKYINSVNNKEETFLDYINNINEIYKKKKDEDYCCDKNYDLCYSYFHCDPKYDPSNLLLMLDNKVKKPTEKASDKSVPNSDTPPNTNPFNTKYRTTIHNVKCLINYGARNDGYAFLSCYNIGKGYQNVEHIFTPTEKEKKKASEDPGKDIEVSKDKEQKTSELLAIDVSKSQSAASNNGGRVATSTSPKIGIPESLKGYTFIGEYVRKEAKENYGIYQLGRRVAQLFSGIGNTHNVGNAEIKVNCSNSRIEEGKLICVNLQDGKEEYVYEKGIITGSNSSSAAFSTGMFNQEFQSNLLDTDYFRIGSVATLLLGFSFVFFLYFKVYTNYISKYKHILFGICIFIMNYPHDVLHIYYFFFI